MISEQFIISPKQRNLLNSLDLLRSSKILQKDTYNRENLGDNIAVSSTE